MKKLTVLTLLLAAAGCANQSTMVYKNDGARQCEAGGTSLAQSRSELTDARVEVFDSHCGAMTGMAVMSVCGAPTLGIHLHEISVGDRQRAEQQGFADTRGLIDKEQGIGFTVVPCRDF
jgi:hypothetical protein